MRYEGCHDEVALHSMLQSCSVISIVNIDAGFVAGAFAAQIANNCAKIEGTCENMDEGMEKVACEKKG